MHFEMQRIEGLFWLFFTRFQKSATFLQQTQGQGVESYCDDAGNCVYS